MPSSGTFFAMTFLIGLVSSAPASYSAQQVEEAAPACILPTSIQGSVVLDPDCTYSGTIEISVSDVTLDCRGSVINAKGHKSGVVVQGKFLRNIVIKNCRIEGADSEGLLIRSPMSARELEAFPVPERYAMASQQVSILSSTIANSGSAGIYVGHYTQDTAINDVTVEQSGSIGVYLDASSIRTSIESSQFLSNGYGDPLKRREAKRNREAIAIDSSAFNRIRGNKFKGNSAGGIFLYKNCWESHTDPKQARRWQHSSYNVIESNTFEEKVGVWVASRQARNLKNMDCGDPALAPGYYRDYADNNTISKNRFTGGEVGVNAQDDFTTLTENNFTGQQKACILVGSRKRDELIGAPIEGTTLKSNFCDAEKGPGFSIEGSTSFQQCSGNVLFGRTYDCSQ